MFTRAKSGRQPNVKFAHEWNLPLGSRRFWVVARLVGVLATLALALSASPSTALAGGGYGGGGSNCGYGWNGYGCSGGGGSECINGWYGYGCEQCYFEYGCESVSFSITKEQRIQGESSYTTSKLTGDVGKKIEYKITV